MKTIKLDDIIIKNRQRRHFDEKALVKLADSIKSKGLMHPIVLRNDGRTLVAGERRTRAVKMLAELSVGIQYNGQQLSPGEIPFVTMQELSETDLIEAELEENILREDLTWKEESEAIAKLHELRLAENPRHTQKETAAEIAGRAPTSNEQLKVREALIIKKHLDDPEIAAASNAKEALKRIKKKQERELTARLAESFDIETTEHIFNCGDFRDFTMLLEANSVDCILTDPPYGVSADEFGSQAANAHGYLDSPEYFQEIVKSWAVETSRVAKAAAHLYVFCDPRNFSYLQKLLTTYGWECWETPLIWYKGNQGMLPKPDHGPRRTYETILFASRGNKQVTAIYHDVITIPGLHSPKFGAEKPVDLYHNLLRRSVRPGDLVWDAFAGAGPIFPAANRCKVKVVATELDPDKYNYAKLRTQSTEESASSATLEEMFND